MNKQASEYPAVVFASQAPPCLSLYQNTHRRYPENQQDPIRFRNLVKELEESLAGKYPKREIEPLLRPYYNLSEDHRFWNHTLDGLAVLGAPGMFKIYKLQEDVKDRAVVSDSFYTKPLLRIFQSHDRYQVLGLTRNEIRLYEGTKDSLDEVPLAGGVPRTLVEALGGETTAPHQTVASYGGAKGPAMHHGHGSKRDEDKLDAERFFRIVDKGILEHHSQPSGLSLLLAALPENQGLFRQISQNPYVLKEGIDTNPDALEMQKMHQKAWEVFEPENRKRLRDRVEAYGDAQSKGLGSGDVEDIAKAAVAGTIDTLLVDSDIHVPGRLDRVIGSVAFDEPDNPAAGDVLDDIGELVLKKGGTVHVIPTEKMPSLTGLAAIFRF